MKQSLHRYLAPIAGGALLAVLLSPLPALAHHGWGGNEDKEFELSGTVTTSVSLAGPHGTMKIKDAQGNIWDVTMAPPFRTQQAGLKAAPSSLAQQAPWRPMSAPALPATLRASWCVRRPRSGRGSCRTHPP